MFLHILGSNSLFVKEFYKMLSQRFDKNEHVFMGHYPDEAEYAKLDGCQIVQSRSIKMPIYLYKSDHIIVHGLFNKTVILALFLQPWLLKKCNWIVYGADIYSHRKENKSFSEKILEYMKQRIAPKIPYISTTCDGDWKLVQEWYGVKGKKLKATYPLAGCNSKLVSKIRDSQKDSEHIHILVGNSATITNHHKDSLDMLAKFKHENICIHMPLNYGDSGYQVYAKEVIAYAENIFGKDKVFPLTERMTGNDYLRYLNQMDVCLFNNDRQQGMGNITQALLLGVKIYIRQGTTMWDHYRSLGCDLHDIAEISFLENIVQLVSEDDVQKQQNINAAAARQDMDLKIHYWTILFNTMKGKPDQ